MKTKGCKAARRFTVALDITGAAFEDQGNELAWILRKLADRLDPHSALSVPAHLSLLDSNGNTVGHAEVI